ncbi:unnamed protein product [Aureobasidium mustum]|uniref:Zn(2)-C6 fungal-type domain-containing protein n=1 Tax=Aureobasidium mustum TaxID=2773714 RepID=A0A9N8JRC6_9PEZI|nr:unnamed protein product [Aureobasidium mustum]
MATRTSKGRSKQGCMTCKDRHLKCDESRPVCRNCRKVGRECVQRDGSRTHPSSTGGNLTSANAPNTNAATTVGKLRVSLNGNNTSETAKAANTVSDIAKPLGEYKEGEVDSTNLDNDINNLAQNIKNLRYPQTTIMDKKTATKPKSAAPVPGSDKNLSKSPTTSKPSEPEMNDNKKPSHPAPGAKFVSTLSLASTTTDRPPGPNFTPLRPMTHWVHPRPAIIPRTEATDAEKAEIRAEQAARKAEKEAEKQQKKRENEFLVARAKEAQMQVGAQQLGGYRDCTYGTCLESAAACKCDPYLMEDSE